MSHKKGDQDQDKDKKNGNARADHGRHHDCCGAKLFHKSAAWSPSWSTVHNRLCGIIAK